MIKKISLTIIVIISLVLNMSFGQTSSDTGVFKNVNVSDFSELVKSDMGELLDVRTVREFQSGHIDGAKNIVFSMFGFESVLKGLNKNKTYYIYCRSGSRSGRAMKVMKKVGFKNVYNLNGGLMTWQSRGMPVVK